MRAVKAMAACIDRLTRGVAMAALFLLVAVTAIDVVGRVAFAAPLGFTFELAGVLLGIALYFGLFGANWRRQHIRIDLLEEVLARSPLVARICDVLSWLMEAAFCLLVTIMVIRQSGKVALWAERFYFMPMEKWMPMAVYGVALIVATGAFLLHLSRIRAEERA